MRYAMKNARVLLASLLFCILALALLAIVPALYSTPIGGSSDATRLGAFTGPEAGTAQDDNVKASLDLAHTDLDAILADTGTDGVVLAADAITAAKIAANAIAASEIADDAIDAGAIATSAIGAAELAADAIGASEIADDAIDAGAIAANAITTSELATGCISSDEVADNAIDAGAIATDAITSDEIAANAIGASEIATDAIGAAELADSAIDAASIATDAIGAAEIADSAIDAGAIAANAITAAKIGTNAFTSDEVSNSFAAEIADKVQGSMDANSTVLASLNSDAGLAAVGSTLVDNIVEAIDTNSVQTDLSDIGDKIVADMDANSTQTNLSVVGDKVVADMDANSVRLAYVLAMERSVSKTVSTIANGANNLFAVTGGPIKITEIVAYVTTTQIGAESCLIGYNIDPNTPATDTAFGTDGTALEINGDAVGTLYMWDGVLATDLTEVTNGVSLAMGTDVSYGLICPIGMVELTAAHDGAITGEITVYMTYIPLSAASVVTAQ